MNYVFFIIPEIILQGTGRKGKGYLRLNVNLLKPHSQQVGDWSKYVSVRHVDDEWVQYWARNKMPMLQFLPTSLAVFIINNLRKQLKLIDDPPLPRNQAFYEDDSGTRWSMHRLSLLLKEVLVQEADGTQLGVVGGIELESDNFMNMQRVRCRTLSTYFGRTRQVGHYFISVS